MRLCQALYLQTPSQHDRSNGLTPILMWFPTLALLQHQRQDGHPSRRSHTGAWLFSATTVEVFHSCCLLWGLPCGSQVCSAMIVVCILTKLKLMPSKFVEIQGMLP